MLAQLSRAVVTATLLLLFGAAASAQTPDGGAPAEAETEGARALFNQGLTYAASGDWINASRSFRAALNLRQAPAIEFNLAAALFELGEVDEAAQLTSSVLANGETPDAVRAPAEELWARIRAGSGTLVVTVRGAAPSDLEIRLDDHVVPEARVGAELTVAVGPRVVTAHRDGAEVARTEVEVRVDQPATAELVVAPAPGDVTPPDDTPPPTETPSNGDGGASPALVWGLVAGGVVLVAVAVIVIAVVASSGGGVVQGDFEPGVLTW